MGGISVPSSCLSSLSSSHPGQCLAVVHTHQASTPGPLHLLSLCPVPPSVTASSQAPVPVWLAPETFPGLPEAASLRKSPLPQQTSWLGSWAQPRDSESRHASRPPLDLGRQPWGQVVPGSAWHRGLSLSPAVGGNHVCSPRLPGYRWEGMASPHPGSPDFTHSASHPWLPCPECEAKAHLGHRLTHVIGPASAAGQPASPNLRNPALSS